LTSEQGLSKGSSWQYPVFIVVVSCTATSPNGEGIARGQVVSQKISVSHWIGNATVTLKRTLECFSVI